MGSKPGSLLIDYPKNMSIQRKLVNVLDRPGGRTILSWIATLYARRLVGGDALVFFDEIWGHLTDGFYIPDTRAFSYYTNGIENWCSTFKERIRGTKEYWYYLYTPRDGDVILDVGAGDGEDILSFSKSVGESGRVIAIEAHPVTFRALRKLCRWNDLKNTTCFQYAVVDKPRAVFIEDVELFIANTVSLDGNNGKEGIPVPGLDLDEICRIAEISHIDLLKMNVEGAERLATEGMKATLGKTRYICIACHDFRANRGESELYRTKDVMKRCLHKHGYDVFFKGGPSCRLRSRPCSRQE